MSDHTGNLDARLAALESRLGRLEGLLAADQLGDAKRSIQAWVTE